MKAVRLLASFCIVASVSGAATPPESPAKAAGAQTVALRDAERSFLDAFFNGDLRKLTAVESATFTLVTPTLMMDKHGHLRSTRERIATGGTADLKVSYEISSQSIRFYDEVAVILDVCSFTGSALGDISTGRYWQTEVWHREGGQWRIVHMQIGMLEHGM